MARLCCLCSLLAFLVSGSQALPAASAGSGWIAHWIGPDPIAGSAAPADQWICYRTTFELQQSAVHARARVAVDSRYFLWINGNLAVFEGGLKRGPNPADTYYDNVEIGSYLHRGRNTIAILQCYWGIDGFSHKSSGTPGLLFELRTAGVSIVTNQNWKMLKHPAFGHAGGRQPNMRISERPILFDARNDIDGWTEPQYKDYSWPNAKDLGAPPCGPWHVLLERPIPLWKNSGLVPYAATVETNTLNEQKTVQAELPYNAQVTPYLKVDAPAGEKILIDSDDPLNEIHVEYITRGGVQEFESFAWMNGNHIVYTLPKSIKVLRLLYRETGYNTDFTGSFTCDDPNLNRLWKLCSRTLYVTMRDNFMDCPDRERGQWWGDAVNEIGETFYSLSPSSSRLARKAMYNLMDRQKPDGTIFSPVPAGNWSTELPTQMLASIGKYGFWTYAMYSGDTKTIMELYPAVRKYLTLWTVGKDGLVVHRPGGWDWLDWGENIDVKMLDNAWFALALEGASNMAKCAGYPLEAATYSKLRLGIIDSVNSQLWDDNLKAYKDPAHNGPPDDRANGLAVVAGIAPRKSYPAITRTLQTQKWASPYMEKYVLEALMMMDHSEVALERMRDRYKEVIASKLSTLPETFPMGGTMNHAWSGGPLTILSQYAAGVSPTSFGYKTYTIQPRVSSLKTVHSVVDTVRGKIDLQIFRQNEDTLCILDSPEGTVANVILPTGKFTWNLTVNGHPPSQIRMKDGSVMVSLKPGHWRVELVH